MNGISHKKIYFNLISFSPLILHIYKNILLDSGSMLFCDMTHRTPLQIENGQHELFMGQKIEQQEE